MKFNIPAEYKHASGVYIIRNTVNKKVYVGSTRKFSGRFLEHRQDLKVGRANPKLQRFVAKHGIDALLFELLEVVPLSKDLLLAAEQKWLDELQPFERTLGFNILPIAGSCLGIKWSEERKAKAKLTRKPLTAAQKEIFTEASRKPRTAETRAKISASKKGLKLNLSPEQRQKAIDRLAKRLTPEAVQKRLANLKIYNESRRAKLIELTCSKCGAIFFKKPYLMRVFCGKSCAISARMTDEQKQKISNERKGQYAGIKWSPERIAKRTATFKANRQQQQEQPTLS